MVLNRLFNKSEVYADRGELPVHIAIIMDGNGRWARKRGLPRIAGHREGSATLKKIVKACDKIGIKYLTVYAFSTENWARPENEVNALMDLLLEYLRSADKEIEGTNIRIRVIGNLERLSREIREEIARVTGITEKNDGMNLIIALNYGGRDELVHAIRKIAGDVASRKLQISDITEKTISDFLYTAGVPDPDLIIRPSGEQRLSNFLLWQSSYSEFWYSNILWPDFKESDLLKAISDYRKRNRRYGGI